MDASTSPFGWKGNAPALGILAVASAIVAIVLGSSLSSAAYKIGKDQEDQRKFVVKYSPLEAYEERIVYTMNYVQHSSAVNDVVFLGDSSCLHGINVQAFEEASGLRAFNVAGADWLGWKGYLLTLEQYIAHHPSPKAVVICLAPYAFHDRIRPYETRFVWSFGSGAEEDRPKHRVDFLYYTAEGIRMSCADWNDSIYSAFNDNFKANHFAIEPQRYKELNIDQKGSIGLKGITDKAHYIFPIVVSEQPRRCMDELCGICATNDIKMIIMIMPFRPGAMTKSLEPVRSYLNEIRSTWKNVIVLDSRSLNYPKELFYDNVHLNIYGAAEMSKHLGDEVNKLMGTH